MGYDTASGLKKYTDLGWVDEVIAIEEHLIFNHYPPLPVAIAEACQEAIRHARDDNWDERVNLPDGWSVNGRLSLTAGELVDMCHLEAFL